MKTDSCVEDITSLREKKKWERKIKKKKKCSTHSVFSRYCKTTDRDTTYSSIMWAEHQSELTFFTY